ncbi:MAG: hypothetical protein IPK99_03890 [Flavobacteriales bacterium]|nr:hypothetical protein [Flavobacteriales bacterium]
MLCADLDPTGGTTVGPGGGGMLVLNGAIFDNNWRDVLRAPYTDSVDQVVNNCSFLTNRALAYPQLFPNTHVSMYRTGRTTFHGCSFGNYRLDLPSDAIQRGLFGITAAEADVIIEPLTDGAPTNKFHNLCFGVGHMSIANYPILVVDSAAFKGCARSLFVTATNNVTFTRNTVEVGSTPWNDYGTYMYNSIWFEFENNVFKGAASDGPQAGSIFSSLGASSESVYNNKYDGFTGNSNDRYSAGLIMSGPNSSALDTIGLTWKCNNFSTTNENDHDVAFTDEEVTVAGQQGSIQNAQSPAGNIYANLQNNCTNEPDKHIYVEDGNVSTFNYVHHTDESQIELVPDCASPPILVSDSLGSWYTEAPTQYSSDPVTGSCPSQLSFQLDEEDLEDEIIYAAEQKQTLVEVYDNWKDGGDSQHLIQFIQDSDNDSYEVRNELMLVAPSVTVEAWEEVFERIPAMNPWHIAQALLANSPLQAAVLRMLPEYDFHPYYEALVLDAQNEGTSMHNTYLGEIAHFRNQHARALGDLTRQALRSGSSTDLTNARIWHEEHPVNTSPQSIVGLSYALGDLERARQIVDNELDVSPDRDYWEVQELYLSLRENGKGRRLWMRVGNRRYCPLL